MGSLNLKTPILIRNLLLLIIGIYCAFIFMNKNSFYSYSISYVYTIIDVYDPYLYPKIIFYFHFISLGTITLLLVYQRYLLSLVLLLPLLIFSGAGIFFNVPNDCGCFGDILAFPDSSFQFVGYIFQLYY